MPICNTARVPLRRDPAPHFLRPWFYYLDAPSGEDHTLSLHGALPIWDTARDPLRRDPAPHFRRPWGDGNERSEEHTSELQSQAKLVCRLLLEKKNTRRRRHGSPRSTDDATHRSQGRTSELQSPSNRVR